MEGLATLILPRFPEAYPSGIGQFELLRAEIAGDFFNLSARPGAAGRIASALRLWFQFPSRIAVAVPLGVHAGDKAMLIERGTMLARAALRSAIDVMNRACWRLPMRGGRAQATIWYLPGRSKMSVKSGPSHCDPGSWQVVPGFPPVRSQ